MRHVAALGIIAVLTGTWNPVPAQTPLQPVHHVYPTSTLQEIQQAIDDGGTVFFHDGEYNQIASSTPDLPPTPANPAKGFNIGKYGNDVNIIGLPGPNGERPKINGGTVAFRVGLLPGYGFAGLPVNFSIENLELFNPDLAGPDVLYSRVGIFVVDRIGTRTTIRNCKITVTGKDTDPGTANNHSSAIWIRLMGAQTLADGARIDITDNEITGTRILAGIVFGHFRAEGPTYIPPRLRIGGNSIEAARLRGYAGTGAAIFLAGNHSNSVVANNAIRGDARSPGFTAVTSAIRYARSGQLPSSNITVAGNDASGFIGDVQLLLDRTVSGGAITGNAFGAAVQVGAMVYGSDNRIGQNHFYGAYPGWESAASGPGLFWFANTTASTSHGNTLVASKLNGPPHGFDICSQVFDETDIPVTPGYDGANKIPAYEKCETKSVEFQQRMQERKAALDARFTQGYGAERPPQ